MRQVTKKDFETGYHYYGARYYDSEKINWLSVDPLSDKYPSISPYAYCANNPVRYIDPDGRDWYETYNTKTKQEEIKWTKHKSQSEMDAAKIQGKYLGKAVVVFNGYHDEKLGEGGNFKNKGAKLANVTVYGPKNENDIANYDGYTMSSDPNIFGVVADGIYTVNRLNKNERKGPFGSDLIIESRSAKIPALNDVNNAHPERSPGYLEGVFIHRCNNNGFAGTFKKGNKYGGISEGCLLILPDQWNRFETQLKDVNSFCLKIKRK